MENKVLDVKFVTFPLLGVSTHPAPRGLTLEASLLHGSSEDECEKGVFDIRVFWVPEFRVLIFSGAKGR